MRLIGPPQVVGSSSVVNDYDREDESHGQQVLWCKLRSSLVSPLLPIPFTQGEASSLTSHFASSRSPRSSSK